MNFLFFYLIPFNVIEIDYCFKLYFAPLKSLINFRWKNCEDKKINYYKIN